MDFPLADAAGPRDEEEGEGSDGSATSRSSEGGQ